MKALKAVLIGVGFISMSLVGVGVIARVAVELMALGWRVLP